MKKESIKHYLHPMTPLPTSIMARGELKEKPQCVLFDIYGTLIISGSGDISFTKQNSPETQELRQFLRKYAIRKTPQTRDKALLFHRG